MDERFVSIIIPCRNEERFIAECLESVLANDYPKEKLEILIVDGMSTDKTREIVKKFEKRASERSEGEDENGVLIAHPSEAKDQDENGVLIALRNSQFEIKLLDNPKIVTPAAMNVGIKNAKGEVIIKMDAHSVYEKDYVSKCVERLIKSGAGNVGGVLKAVPSKNTLTAKAIALSLSHFFGAAGSYFRTGAAKPREVDTVAFGCYWKKIFDRIGLYDERMAQIEDLEFNYRLRKAGGKIMLFPDIKATYYPSSDNLVSFLKHNFTDGIWATYPLKYGFKVSLRHLIPLIFVLTLPLSIWPYLPASLFFSLQIAVREKDLKLVFVMPAAFFARHLGYGVGSIIGLIKLLINSNGGKKKDRN